MRGFDCMDWPTMYRQAHALPDSREVIVHQDEWW